MHSAHDPWSLGGTDRSADSVDDVAFRDAMARLGGGVCVLTTLDLVGRDCGLTMTAVSSLSLEPPLIVAAVRHGSFIHDALSVADGWAVTVLADDQLDLARYASRHRYPTDVDDFGRWETVRGKASGALVFTGGVAAVDCVPYQLFDAGDHTLAVGRVVSTAFPGLGQTPLLHVDRKWYRPGEELD